MELVSCAICGQDSASLLFVKWGHNIVRCRQCALAYVNPRAFKVEDDSYFRGPYLSTIESGGVLRSEIENLYAEILNNVAAHLIPGRLLDVGCAMGHFMVYARGLGWTVRGIECSKFAADYGSQRWGLHIQPACDVRHARLPDTHFDTAVLIEVIEHLPHPRQALSEIFHLLKPGGMIYITTPNFDSFRALLLREEWQPVIPSGHLYYFTEHSLLNLLTAVGFTQVIDLSRHAVLESEVESLRATGLEFSESEIETLTERVRREDAGKLFNGRGEGLAMSAVKPLSEEDTIRASLRCAQPLPQLDNELICCSGESADDQKVYLVRAGRKHWVTTTEWLSRHGMRLDRTIQVDRGVLRSIVTGPPLT